MPDWRISPEGLVAFRPLEELGRRMGAPIVELKSVPLAQGAGETFYPGEIEARNDVSNRRDGLLLPDDPVADMRKLADELGLRESLAFA